MTLNKHGILKTQMLFVLLLICTSISKAQTWSEWFEQKKTQIRYLSEQIAALHVYGSLANKGYEIVERGIATIKNVKDGDFSLHSNYFASLNAPSASVKNYPKIQEIVAIQKKILATYTNYLTLEKNSKAFSNAESKYCRHVYANLLRECSETIKNLVLVITADNHVMKDDERLKRIDRLYATILDMYEFSRSFQVSMNTLLIQREKEQRQANTIRKLKGIE